PRFTSPVSLSSFVVHSFLFTPPPTPEIYTLSLHDALPILRSESLNDRDGYDNLPAPAFLAVWWGVYWTWAAVERVFGFLAPNTQDRKSTRLNSSHEWISYAVFCLKKKKKKSI